MGSEAVPGDLLHAQTVPRMLVICWTAKDLKVAGESRGRGRSHEKVLPVRSSCDLSVTPESPNPRPFSQRLKIQVPDVVSRLHQYKANVTSKVAIQRAVRDKEELACCSFAPVLVSKSYKSTKSRYAQALLSGSLQKHTVEEKVLTTSQPDVPRINTQISPEIKRKDDPGNRVDTLHTALTTRTLDYKENLTFRPSINTTSTRLNRTQPVADLLYQDALRRQEKPRSSLPFPEVEKNPVSKEIMRKRFRREFYAGVEETFGQGKLTVNMAETRQLLIKLRFIEGKSSDYKGFFRQVTTSKELQVDTLYVNLSEILGLMETQGALRQTYHGFFLNRLRLPGSGSSIPSEKPVRPEYRTEDLIYQRKVRKTEV